jgi:hypothetical protein
MGHFFFNLKAWLLIIKKREQTMHYPLRVVNKIKSLAHGPDLFHGLSMWVGPHTWHVCFLI